MESKTPVARKTGAARAKTESSGSQAKVVKKILKQMEAKLSGKDARATLGDYIRLVQLEKELEADEAKEIKVTWVEPAETKPESEE